MSHNTLTRRATFFAGMRAALPLVVGFFPFGVIYGVSALHVGISPTLTQAMSLIVFAGSAQIVMVSLLAEHTPLLLIIITAFVINVRHMLYSASVAPYVQHLSLRWKAVLAYVLIDETYAVTIPYLQDNNAPHHAHWFFMGAGATLSSLWQLSTAVGLLVGTQVPPAWGLDFTIALTFIALVVPLFHDRASVVAALSATVVAVVFAWLPYKMALIMAAVIGMGIGLLIERNAP